MDRYPEGIVKVLSIQGVRDFHNAEADLRTISSNGDPYERAFVPSSLEHLSIGGLASTLQVISSWANALPLGQRVIRLEIDESMTSDEVSGLVTRDHVFLACLLADRIENSAGRDVTDTVARALSLHQARLDSKSHHTDSSRILSVSSTGLQNSISTLTHGARQVTAPAFRPDATRVSALIRPIRSTLANATNSWWPGGKRISEDKRRELEGDVTDLMFELLDNIYSWGRSRWLSRGRKAVLANSLQFFRAESLDLPVAELIEGAGVDTPIETYVGQSLPNYLFGRGNKGITFQARMIELTFFDSGEGLAYWMAADGAPRTNYLTFKDEIRYTASALQRGSGARDTIFFLSGQGIPRALEAISKLGGFVHLRTGRMSLFRDFIVEPFSADEHQDTDALFGTEVELRYFRDWSTRRRAFSEFEPSRGTTYTVLLPVFEELPRSRAR
jgi:hypothetical protein